MRVAIIVLAAAAVALGSTASADPYKDFAAQGYRWVAVDGPYALLEAKMVCERLAKPTYHRQRVFAQLGG